MAINFKDLSALKILALGFVGGLFFILVATGVILALIIFPVILVICGVINGVIRLYDLPGEFMARRAKKKPPPCRKYGSPQRPHQPP